MGKTENNAALWKAQKELPKAKQRPQDRHPEFMEYRRTLNINAGSATINPYVSKILAFKPESWLFDPLDIKSKPYPIMVETRPIFMEMMEDINQQKVIAVDFEENQHHSFMGMLMYMQVSTENNNFIIHIPSCFKWLKDEMRAVLESDSIVKIVHGGDNDILFLQRDLNIFATAVVDTQHVYNYVYGISEKGYKIGFKIMAEELLKSTFPVDFDSSLQLADWRIYPLPHEMRLYAMYDTFLLLKCWDKLRVNLIDGNWELSSLNPFIKSNAKTAKSYKGKTYPTVFTDLARLPVPSGMTDLFTKLHIWREQRAKFIDEPPTEVINTREIMKIIQAAPTSEEELKTVFAPFNIPKWISGVKDEIFGILAQPQQDVSMEADDESWEEVELLIHAPEEEIQLPPAAKVCDSTKPTKKLKQRYQLFVRDTSSLKQLPEVRKKWTSNPPSGRRQVTMNVPLKLKRQQRPSGVPRKRRELSPETRRYQRRRRTFNYRRNRRERKCQIHLQPAATDEGPSREGPLKGGVCNAHGL